MMGYMLSNNALHTCCSACLCLICISILTPCVCGIPEHSHRCSLQTIWQSTRCDLSINSKAHACRHTKMHQHDQGCASDRYAISADSQLNNESVIWWHTSGIASFVRNKIQTLHVKGCIVCCVLFRSGAMHFFLVPPVAPEFTTIPATQT